MGKGKGKTDLSSYVDLSAQDLHSGFLNRLYTSRDYEAGLVNLMKESYEVIFQTPSYLCTFIVFSPPRAGLSLEDKPGL